MHFLVMLVLYHQHTLHGLGEQCAPRAFLWNIILRWVFGCHITYSLSRLYSEPSNHGLSWQFRHFYQTQCQSTCFPCFQGSSQLCVCTIFQGPCQGVKSWTPGKTPYTCKLSFIQILCSTSQFITQNPLLERHSGLLGINLQYFSNMSPQCTVT